MSERVFRDGTDQRNFYDVLLRKYKKLSDNMYLNQEEQQIKEDYEEIQNVLDEYVIVVSPEEKKKELIKSIRELGRLPKQKGHLKGVSERVFRDGTDQRNFYDVLLRKYKKLSDNMYLNQEEQRIKEDYEEIQRVLFEQQKNETTDVKKKMLMNVRNILEDAKNVAPTEGIARITENISNCQKKQ